MRRLAFVALLCAGCGSSPEKPPPPTQPEGPTASVGPVPSEQEMKALAANVTDYPTKFRLAKIGWPAVPVLLAQLTHEKPWVVWESKSALRWIATYAVDRPSCVRAFAAGTAKDRSLVARLYAAEMLGELDSPLAVPALAGLLDDAAVRDAALEALARTHDASAGDAIAARARSGAPELRAKALRALAIHRSHTPVLIAASNDPAVAEAALEALGMCGDAAAADALVAKKAVGPLLRLAQDHPPLAARAYDIASTDAERAAALAAVGGRADALPLVEKAEQSPSEAVRTAAFRAHVSIADAMDAKGASPHYLRVLSRATDEGVLSRALSGTTRLHTPEGVAAAEKLLHHPNAGVQRAAVTALRDGPDATKALLTALEGPAKLLVLDALASRRDPASIPAIAAIAAKGTGAAQLAAIRALGRIGPAAAAALAEIVETETPAVRSAGVEALLSIAHASAPAQARDVYHRILEVGGPVHQLAALEALARIADAASLPKIEKLLEKAEGDLQLAALRCTVEIAPKLGREEALAVLKRAHEGGVTGLEPKLRALGERVEITAQEGRIEDWWAIGPFPTKGLESWSDECGPEQEVDLAKEIEHDGKPLKWRSLSATGEDGRVVFDNVYKPNDRVAAYAYAEVIVRKERDAFVRSGSDDGMILWVNGEKAHEVLKPRSLQVDEDKVKVHLKEGANHILVKVIDEGGGWEFHLRLEDEEGRPLKFKVR